MKDDTRCIDCQCSNCGYNNDEKCGNCTNCENNHNQIWDYSCGTWISYREIKQK